MAKVELRAADLEDPERPPASNDEALKASNAAQSDRISGVGRQQREVKGACTVARPTSW